MCGDVDLAGILGNAWADAEGLVGGDGWWEGYLFSPERSLWRAGSLPQK